MRVIVYDAINHDEKESYSNINLVTLTTKPRTLYVHRRGEAPIEHPLKTGEFYGIVQEPNDYA